MADIRLQDYVAKIKELIRSVRLDEAIAHCQHILRHYPKHIETYSLLGEACLEKQLYREAIEFFQRTLGADPENLMSRVGLGVIYDEQGAVPEAIWQLERAFELVPGNSEVRRELLRLYGQYDGIDKSRLKLTRGALGRLYSRNGLYERAIGEFHAVLRQDPELPDIRIALIEALWREGRQLETVEMCMELLDALPNCLKANLILGTIWLRGGNEESAEQRLSVARALDPENRIAQELMGADSPLPPEDVFIPELDAIPDEFEFSLSDVPGAGAVVAAEAKDLVAESVADEEEQDLWGADEELPEWLRDVGVTAEEPALELAPDEAGIEPSPDEALPVEDMPEWLQEVMGEKGAAPAAEPGLAEGEDVDDEFFAVEDAPEPLQDIESPDLVQADLAGNAAIAAGLAAAGMIGDEQEESAEEETLAEAIPEWLQELVGAGGSPADEELVPEQELRAPVVAEPGEEPPSIEEESLPDKDEPEIIPEWVTALGAAGVAGVAALSLVGDEEDIPPDGETPDRAPDSVQDLDTIAVEEAGAEPIVEVEGEAEDELLSDEEIPDWLRDLGVAQVAESVEPPALEVETEVLPIQPAAEAEEEALPDEEVPPGEAPDDLPDWLRDLEDVDMEEMAGLAVAEAEEKALPDEEVPPGEAPDDLPDWLRDLEDVDMEEMAGLAVAEAEEEALPEQEVMARVAPGELPDWLRDLEDVDVEEMAGPAVADAEEEALPEQEVMAGEAPDDLPDWLRHLEKPEAEESAVPAVGEDDELPAVAEEVPLIDEIPDWLRDLDKVEVEEISASPALGDEAGAGQDHEGAIPASLLALVAAGLLDESDLESAMAEMSDEELEAQRAEMVPGWLSELVEETPAAVEAEPAEGEPFLQEIATPVLEIPLEEEPVLTEPEAEVLVEEVVAEIVEAEPEAEIPVEEVLAEVVEAEPEAGAPIEEVVAEVVEPEPEAGVPIEEVLAEVVEAEPEAEALVEEAMVEIVEAEPEAEALVEEAMVEIVEAEPEAGAPIEEVLAEVVEPEPEAEAPVEEVVAEVVEPEPEAEALVEEVVAEVVEPEPEAEIPVEEVWAEVVEPEPEAEALVEEVVAEVIEPEADLVVEVAAEEGLVAPAREDQLLQQLKSRPRDYASRLELARLYYDEHDWDAALTNYEKLISARRFLPDIVADLESLAQQDVDPARVYHMLGDAYMQQDQLDEALEMYRRARRSLAKR